MRPVLVAPPSPDREPPGSAPPVSGCSGGNCGDCGLAGAEAASARIETAGWTGGRQAVLAGVVFILPLPLAAGGALLGETPLHQLLGAALGLGVGVALARGISTFFLSSEAPSRSPHTPTEKR
ncbi:MAG: hypothetical protein Q9Q40_01220 [Acidobacteriota bacterium]|nr:hypothetical protein [Acidobacteriota bacterium]MDQ7087556.1 hypothetical protein [Acidobacteriota bacterium]